MTEQPDELTDFTVGLIKRPLTKGDELFIFAGGMLRGKVTEVDVRREFPSDTYLRTNYVDMDDVVDCLRLVYIPRQRNPNEPPRFTRKPQYFNIPLKFLSGVYIKKIEDGKWMLNIDTRKRT